MLEYRAAVVIPTHREIPTPIEEIGLRRCAEVCRHPIILVTPESLPIQAYQEILPIFRHIALPKEWMSSIQAYNKLMISGKVFAAIDGFSHVLIHEPDAILLDDQTDYWCSQPIDYVGAPWFSSEPPDNQPRLFACGNSGLSLLRLSAFKKLLSSQARWYPFKQVSKDLIKGALGNPRRLRRGIAGLGSAGQIRGAWRLYEGHCDIFWSLEVAHTADRLRVVDPLSALSFSWEAYPRECSRLAEGRPPMGLHAWMKYEPDFTCKLLRNHGISVPADLF